MDIVKFVAEKTGVTEDQARGGLGLVLGLFKTQMTEESYSKLIGFIPNASEMLAAAPDSGGIMAAVGGMISSGAGEMAKVAQGFTDLGMDETKIPQFMAAVADAAGKEGEPVLADAVRMSAP